MTLPELILAETSFALPPSQRVYGWGEQQLDRMFRDINLDRFAAASPTLEPVADWFFFGTIYLARDEAAQLTYIADGQQRFVTGTMIYAVARDFETDPVERERLHSYVAAPGGGFRLRLRDVDADFFETWVQQPGATKRAFAPEVEEALDSGDAGYQSLSESRTNIIANRNAMIDRFQNLQPEGRRRLIKYLETCSEVVVISATRLADATSAYASTYKRGLRQATTDKLKAELLGDAEPQLRAHLGNFWDECEALIGKDELEDLLYLLTLQRTKSASMSDLQSDVLVQFNLPADVEAFIEKRLVPAAQAYGQIVQQGKHIATYLRGSFRDRARLRNIAAHLIALKRTSHLEWRLPAVIALRALRDNISLLEATLMRLERLAAAHMIAGEDPQVMILRYVALAEAIEVRDSTAIEQASAVAPAVATRAKEQLLSPTFATKTRMRMPVLLKVNDLIDGKVGAFDPAEVSCEHVLPQNVSKQNKEWHAAFRTPGGRFNGAAYRHRLGNVTVLSHPLNRKAGSRPYVEKRPLLKQSEHAMSRDCAYHSDWTPAVVEERTQRLVAMLVRHWDL